MIQIGQLRLSKKINTLILLALVISQLFFLLQLYVRTSEAKSFCERANKIIIESDDKLLTSENIPEERILTALRYRSENVKGLMEIAYDKLYSALTGITIVFVIFIVINVFYLARKN